MARKRARPRPAPEVPANLAGLVQACKDDPDDDTLRLVLADYLEDHGETDRAEMIRLSVAVSRPKVEPTSLAAEHARLARLLSVRAGRWLGPLAIAKPIATFERGLIAVQAPFQDLRGARAFADVAAVAPWTERLRLDFSVQRQAVAYLGCSVAAAFPFLDLGYARFDRGHLAVLARSVVAPRLRGLRVLHHGADDPLTALFDAGSGLAGLRSLSVRSRLSLGEVRALVAAPFAAGLRALRLFLPWPAGEAMRVLAASEALAGLRRLELASDGLDDEASGHVLAAAPHLRALETLRLTDARLGDDAGVALAGSPVLAAVRVLDLAGNALSDATALALAESPFVGRVEDLDLGDNRLSDAGVRVLVSSGALPNLRRLDLSCRSAYGWQLDTDAALALAESPHLSNLEALALGGNQRLGRRGIAALARADRLPALRDLDLGRIDVDVRYCVEALADGSFGPRLRRLRLSGPSTGAAALLARSPAFRRLEALDLTGSPFDPAELLALAESATLERLVWLAVDYPADPTAFLVAIARRAGLPALTYLTFGVPPLGPEVPADAAAALAASPRRDDLFFVGVQRHYTHPPELHAMTQGIPQVRPLE